MDTLKLIKAERNLEPKQARKAYEDKITFPSPIPSLRDQFTGTARGSAGMDVSTDNAITIDSLRVHKVPLEVHGPIGKGLSALLLGRSSAMLQGIFVRPDVIDADYKGHICAMVSTPTPPVTTPAKTRIAQLIPFKSCVSKTDSKL